MAFDPSRRTFLKGASVLALGVGGGPSGLVSRLAHAATRADRVLVHVFLRGGLDGLNVVVPYGEPDYYTLRRKLAVARPGRPNGAVPLDDHFGLHPLLEPLKALYEEERLVAIHAVGNYHSTRSHFSAQDFAELGTPGVNTTTTGQLARLAGRLDGGGVLKALSFSAQRPVSLLGAESAIVAKSLEGFDLHAKGWREEAERRLQFMYEGSPLAQTGRDIFSAIQTLKETPALRAHPRQGVVYPAGAPGPSLREAALIINSGIGTRAIFVPVGGRYDTHADQIEAHSIELPLLAQSLVAFARDLGPNLDKVVVLVTTEFGRTAAANGSGGTDHGTGFCALAFGGEIKGGRVLGPWPGLRKKDLFEERDLAVTTDYRDLFIEVAKQHLGVSDPSSLYPGRGESQAVGLFVC